MAKKERSFDVQVPLYGLEAVYLTCYSLLDRAYLRLEGDPSAVVKVRLKERPGQPKGVLEQLEGEFFNELLHQALRVKISSANQKIREYIVARALAAAEGVKTTSGAAAGTSAGSAETVLDEQLEAEIEKLLAEVEKGSDSDPLKIAVPWEDKHGKPEAAAKPNGAGGGENAPAA